ncbi:MAG TPA: bifunctional DNA-formamidopyrimidine glycosylase/DNA-(apurinic or apyrimidinic site) lyase [Vicinamibacterales bacterium]
MPELPEVESVRRVLEPAMLGAQFADVLVRRPDLRQPFPPGFRRRLVGQTVTSLTRRAKYLLAELSSGETLLMHLGMSGGFDVARTSPEPGRHDHVVFRMSTGVSVTFNDPRRFGVMDLIRAGQLTGHRAVGGLGPEPLSEDFDAAALARACRGKKTSLKAALLDQRVVAGLGNIYVSEALHRAGLSPFKRASTLAGRTGVPRPVAFRLVTAIKQVLNAAIDRASRRSSRTEPYGSSRFRVYGREGKRCLRAKCSGTIKRRTQAGRSTFYCPVCQRM